MSGQEEEKLRTLLEKGTRTDSRGRFCRLRTPLMISKKGWTLDQFAMNWERDLLLAYKLFLRDKDGEKSVSDSDVLDRVWINDPSLCQKIKARLLTKDFRVVGLRPSSHEEITLTPRMLEILWPVVETCELIEVGDLLNGRRFSNTFEFSNLLEKPGADVHSRTIGGAYPRR